jgi:hypothetical protein
MDVEAENDPEILDQYSSNALPPAVRSSIAQQRSKPTFKKRTEFRETVYACHSVHLGNSNVLFLLNSGTRREIVPGRIHFIYTQGDHTFFGIARHLEKHTSSVDPFAPYPDFPAKVFSTEYASDLDVIKGENLLCHFARWSISSEECVVLPLSKSGNIW